MKRTTCLSVGRQRRVGHQLDNHCVNDAGLVGSTNSAGPLLDDWHGSGVLGEEVRIVAVEPENVHGHLGQVAGGVVLCDLARARVVTVLVQEGQGQMEEVRVLRQQDEQALDCGGHRRAHHDLLRVAVLVDALDDAFHGHGEGATKKNRSETTTNTDEVWTRRGREFKQAGSLSWSSE